MEWRTMEDYCSGYYLKSKYAHEIKKLLRLELLENFSEIVYDDTYETCPYVSADDFLMGSCELFALALHYKYGYDVFEIVSGGKMVHTFCIGDEFKAFIDVRGITSNINDFMDGVMISSGTDYGIRPRDISEDQRLSNEWDSLAMEFANAIINRHPDYYDVALIMHKPKGMD